MSKRNQISGVVGFMLFLVVLPSIVSCGGKEEAMPIKAVIDYSVAPWDGSAYEILMPLKNVPGSPNPFIRVDIWGNPQFQKVESIHFSGRSDPAERGRAVFQSALNESLPETLIGNISFETLQKGHPVTGTFDLSASGGKTFRGKFQAQWGNRPPQTIR
jgi:hypothetical protein